MIHPGIHAALARERTSTFLAEAEAARLAGQLRRPARGRKARRRGGSAVLIRPVRPADDGLLADGLAAELDHRDHEALGALDHARRGGVGIARHVRDHDDPRTAEIAIAVIDEQKPGADLTGREFGTLEYEVELDCVPVRRARFRGNAPGRVELS
jgi:hypothetical protein